MASFTDSISQFNPYVSQLPIDAMKQVGMYKQQQYDAGVQKIQSQIDNIAGMDIMHDSDKEYIQSKMNELGNNLRTVAAGDFSNQQLVNSVGGMASSIIKDGNIQNAASSTARIKQEQAAMEAARKEGKTSASNIHDFNKQAKAYLDNKEVGQLFRGSYQPYTDVSKKVLDVIGKLHPKADSKDIAYAYKTKKDGTVDIVGILDVMQKKGIKTVDEGQIRTALSAVLDANDYNQLAIDGRYNYKDITQPELTEMAVKDYDRSLKYYSNQLARQKEQLLVTTDPDQQEIINNNIKLYTDLLGDPEKKLKGSLTQNYEKTLGEIAANPNAAKAKIYTKNYLDGIANGFAWAEITDEIVASPAKENFWKMKGYELEVLKRSDTNKYNAAKLKIDQETLDLAKKKFEAENGPGVPYFKTSGDPTTNDLTALQNYTDHNNKLTSSNNTILLELAAKKSSITTAVAPSTIKANIEKYKTGTYTPATVYEKEQMDKYIEQDNQLKNQEAIYNTYENQARNEVTGGVAMDKIINAAISKKGNLTVGGETFTPKEVYNYLMKENWDKAAPTGGGYMTSSSALRRGIDAERLTDKEKLLAKAFQSRYNPRLGDKILDSKVNKYIDDFTPILNQSKEINEKVLTNVAKKMAPITGGFQTQQSAVTFKNNDDKKSFISDVVNVAKADLDQKTGDVGYDPSTSIDLLTKKNSEDVEFQFKRKGNEYFVQITDKQDPKAKGALVRVDADFVSRNKNLGSGWLSPNTDLTDVVLRNAGSTNIFKDAEHAHYQTGKFGGYDNKGNRTVTIPITADLDYQGGELYPVFRIKTNKGDELAFPYPLPTNKQEFERVYLPSLTDEKVINLLKGKYPNIEQLIQQ